MLKNNETMVQAARSAPFLTKEDEARSAIAWQKDGDQESRERLFRSHLRIVVKVVGRMRGHDGRFDDLLTAGATGLLIAIDKFDPESGFRLSTYAPFWIRSHLNEDIYADLNMVRLPSSEKFKRAVTHYRNARRTLGIEHFGRLTYREVLAVADLLAIGPDVVQIVDARYEGSMISMDAHVGREAANTTFGDMMASDEPSPYGTMTRAETDEWSRNTVYACLKGLNPREREVFVRRRLNEDCTLQDLADQYGVTRQRVQQIEAKAAAKFERATLAHRTAALMHLRHQGDVAAA